MRSACPDARICACTVHLGAIYCGASREIWFLTCERAPVFSSGSLRPTFRCRRAGAMRAQARIAEYLQEIFGPTNQIQMPPPPGPAGLSFTQLHSPFELKYRLLIKGKRLPSARASIGLRPAGTQREEAEAADEGDVEDEDDVDGLNDIESAEKLFTMEGLLSNKATTNALSEYLHRQEYTEEVLEALHLIYLPAELLGWAKEIRNGVAPKPEAALAMLTHLSDSCPLALRCIHLSLVAIFEPEQTPPRLEGRCQAFLSELPAPERPLPPALQEALDDVVVVADGNYSEDEVQLLAEVRVKSNARGERGRERRVSRA
eukprot:6207843-Pleurochrysis_carterae.AAC.1